MNQTLAIADVVRRAVQICSPAQVEPKSPLSTFAQLAQQAYVAAQTDALGLSHLEVLAAQADSLAVTDYMERAKQGTARMAEIHYLLTLLVPYEREIRAMIMAPADQPDMTVLRPKPPAPGKTI